MVRWMEWHDIKELEMMEIECSFCKKQITFTMDDVRVSGKAKLLNCPHCSRTVWVEFKGEKYYKENSK